MIYKEKVKPVECGMHCILCGADVCSNKNVKWEEQKDDEYKMEEETKFDKVFV
ncbi:MAG: hypothetical protein LBF97_01685 [Elusimicrobiota bacterium]|jgi:hypothetical protein|nr:hypothetical protein [Elusimicrobiota bacterium]